jgi:hypothetical protein
MVIYGRGDNPDARDQDFLQPLFGMVADRCGVAWMVIA